jgi:hypothetical protein
VEDDFFDGIGFVFEGSDDSETLASLEEGENLAASSGAAIGVDEAELTPSMNR